MGIRNELDRLLHGAVHEVEIEMLKRAAICSENAKLYTPIPDGWECNHKFSTRRVVNGFEQTREG